MMADPSTSGSYSNQSILPVCSNTATATRYGVSLTCYFDFNAGNFSSGYSTSSSGSQPSTDTLSRLAREFARYLSATEKQWLRMINTQPSLEGITTCLTWHARRYCWISRAPHRCGFNRRIPCWRAGRWKSLT